MCDLDWLSQSQSHITIHHDNTYKAILYYDNSTKIT